MNFQELFWQALDKENPVIALRQVMVDLRAQAFEKDILIKELEAFRQLAVARSETDEDVVLEVLDFLVGFCSSHMYIE